MWRFDRFTFEPGEARLRAGNDDIALGPRALDVLRVLVERAGQLVSKAELLEQAWPRVIVEENNLQVQVSSLRKALGAGAITTVPGRGYRFEWAVTAGATTSARAPSGPPASLGDLPVPLAPLLGRATELAGLVSDCRGQRLVTVVGPGGIGKTRLAVDAARALADAGGFARLVFCDLTSVTGGSLVATTLAAAAGVTSFEGDAMAALREHLGVSPVLLFVDNAEHVRAAVAEALNALLPAAPACHALVTSQVPLDLPGEWVFRVGPLSLPAPGASLDEAAESGAVALFVACARAADRRFALTADNVAAVVGICRKLDGIPLALELAGARVPQFGVTGLDARLDQRLRLLARKGPAVPSRQQTLAAALDWSYALLEPAQQALLRRLGVFAGAFELDDAIALGGADALEVTEALAALVERSLVAVSEDDPPRYRLLESVRLYALDRLIAAGEMAVLDQAIDYHATRADRLAASSRESRAALDYARALELCERLPAGPARDRRELALLLKLGPTVQASSSPGSPRCEAIYGRAVELARRGGDGQPRFQALWGYWQFLVMAGRDRDAAALSAELGVLADGLGDDGLQLEASHARFSTAQLLGDARATLEHTQAVIARYDRARHHDLAHEYGGHDPGVCALGQGSVALWLSGYPDRALAMALDAERLGASFDHAYSRAVGFYYSAMTYGACGDIARLSRAAEQLIAVSGQYSMSILLTEGRLYAGRASFERGERAAGLAALGAAYDEIYAARDFGFVPYYATLLADARLSIGEVDRAEVVLEQATAIAEAGQGFFLPEVRRLQGEVARARGNVNAALAAYRQARALAETQGARSLGLRAATSEARLQRELGATDDARRALDAYLAQWPEGFGTRDLREAQDLRAALR